MEVRSCYAHFLAPSAPPARPPRRWSDLSSWLQLTWCAPCNYPESLTLTLFVSSSCAAHALAAPSALLAAAQRVRTNRAKQSRALKPQTLCTSSFRAAPRLPRRWSDLLLLAAAWLMRVDHACHTLFSFQRAACAPAAPLERPVFLVAAHLVRNCVHPAFAPRSIAPLRPLCFHRQISMTVEAPQRGCSGRYCPGNSLLTA